MVLASCSQDRLEAEKAALLPLPEKYQNRVEIAVLESEQDLPYITDYGNAIDFDIDGLALEKNQGRVTFPLTLHVTELTTVGKIIWQGLHSTSGGKLLSTDGQIKVELYKGNDRVELSYPGALDITFRPISVGTPDPEMIIFLGNEKNNAFDWIPDTLNCEVEKETLMCYNIFAGDTFYYLNPSRLGWINIDKFVEEEETTEITLKGNFPVNTYYTYLYFPEIRSIMNVTKHDKVMVPLGRQVDVIAMTFVKDEEVLSFHTSIVVKENMTVPMVLEPGKLQDLYAYLNTLF